jgi:hypothetical protein
MTYRGDIDHCSCKFKGKNTGRWMKADILLK